MTGERKAPAVKNGKLRKKKGKKKKGADRWGQCAARERERASDAGEAKQAAAKQQLGRRVGARARVASWATRGSRPVREGSSGPKRAGRAVQSRAGHRDRPAGGGGGKGPG